MLNHIESQVLSELPQQVPDEVIQIQPPIRTVKEYKTLSRENTSREKWARGRGEVQTRLGLRTLYKIFWALGVSMPKNNKIIYSIWSICINGYVTSCLPVFFMLGLINSVQDDIENIQIGNILTSLQVFFNLSGCSIKTAIMIFQLPKLKKCEPLLAKLDKRCKTAEEQACVHRFNYMAHRLVVLFAGVCLCYLCSSSISALIFHRLPFNLYNPIVNGYKNVWTFIVAAIMECVPSFVVCFQQASNDSYAVIYINIFRCHLKALLLRIERLNEPNSGKTLDENVEELRMCIIDYKNIIELYNRVAPVISITVFVQYTLTACILGTTLINMLLFPTNFASKASSFTYLFVLAVQIFPVCYFAQCLTDENYRLSEVIFHSNWVNQNKRYRKMLIFFIQRSQRPLEFTAGKLFPITLDSFLSIVRFSFSLYTFIKEMDIKQRYGLE